MLGMKPDESIREPFLWANRAQDKQRTWWRRGRYSTSQTIRPLSDQRNDPDSLFSHYRRVIHFRNGHPVLNDNLSRVGETGIRQRETLAFTRQSADGQRVLVVHNLSRKAIDVVLSPNEGWCQQLVWSSVVGAAYQNGVAAIPAYSFVVLS
jgi:glycosidase